MKQIFLKKKEGCPTLLVFFAGWGAEPSMFSPARDCPHDILMCWDYSDMRFDHDLLEGYSELRLLAWSMGVWAAGQIFRASPATASPSSAIAVCGTPFPIDDKKGIPAVIFDGTLDGLSSRSLEKFRRRMCGSSKALEQLLARGLARDLEGLKEELSAIGLACRQDPRPGMRDTGNRTIWTKAIIGGRDMIFPPANQNAAWESLDVPVELTDTAHYDAELLQNLLYRPEAWTKI